MGAGDPAPDGEISGNGFLLSFDVALSINTTGQNQELDGVVISGAEIVSLEASGFIQFNLDGIAGFRIEGDIGVSVTTTGFAVSVSGVLSAQVGGSTLLRLGVSGGLVILADGVNDGIAGRLELTQNAGAIVGGNGFGFDVTFSLEANTTGIAVDVGGETLTAGPYIRVHADGDLSFQLSGGNGFLLRGLFDLAIGATGLEVAASGLLKVQAGGITVFEFSLTAAALLINGSGIAAKIELGSSPISLTGFVLSGGFAFELNTTGAAIGSIAGSSVNLAAGSYIQIQIGGANGGPATIAFGTNGFVLEGTFTLAAGSNGLEVAADARLKVAVGPTTILDVEADGALLINADGIAARISLTFAPGLSGVGFSMSGTFIFELNTTGAAVANIAGQAVNLAAGPYVKITVTNGQIVLGANANNGFRLDASFMLVANAAGLEVAADGTLRAMLGGRP